MQHRLESAITGVLIETQRMAGTRLDPFIDIRTETQHRRALCRRDAQLNCEEWRVVDDDADFLHRGNQEILVALALEHRGEQPH